jgi:molecular chaperone GrpE
MSSDNPMKALEIEHELPSMEDNGNSQNSNNTSGEAASGVTGLRESSRDHDIDPAKLRDRLVRLQADFENARKRASKEQQEFRDYALFDTAKELLPVVDNFERALQTSPSDTAELRTGVELIHKQLLNVLFKLGVRPIHALGDRFDPRIHHAVSTVDTDLVEDGMVVGELQCGYMFKDRLLRPAMVTVARKIPPELTR